MKALVAPVMAGVALALAGLLWLLLVEDGRAIRRLPEPDALAWRSHPAAIVTLLGLGFGFLPMAGWTAYRTWSRGRRRATLAILSDAAGVCLLALVSLTGLVGAVATARYELRLDAAGLRHGGGLWAGPWQVAWDEVRQARYQEGAGRWRFRPLRRLIRRDLWLVGPAGPRRIELSGLSAAERDEVLDWVARRLPIERP